MEDRRWGGRESVGRQVDPDTTNFCNTNACHRLPADARVKELINTDTKTWKTTLIKEVFWEEEAQNILQIPLSPLNAKDRRIWRGTKNGEYSVQSAYHMEMEMSMGASSSCSDPHKGTNYGRIFGSVGSPIQ
jgi:hypothetical protein